MVKTRGYLAVPCIFIIKLSMRSFRRFYSSCRDSSVQWCKWGNEAFDRAILEKKYVLVYSGAANPSVQKLLDDTLFSSPTVRNEINDKFVPIRLDNKNRGVYQSYLMYTQCKSSGVSPPFFLTRVDPKNDIPDNVSWELNGKKSLELLQKPQNISSEEIIKTKNCVNTSTLSEDKEYDREYTLDQAYLQYNDLSYDEFFRFAMGYALSILAGKYPEFVEKELTSMSRSGIVDHIHGGAFIGSYSRDWHLPEFSKQLGWQAMLLNACCSLDSTNDSINYLATQLIKGIEHHITVDRSLIYGSTPTYLWSYEEFVKALKPHFNNLISMDILEMYWGVNVNGNINNDLLSVKSDLLGMNVLTPYNSVNTVASTFGVSPKKVMALVDESKVQLRNFSKPKELQGYEMKLSHYGLALSALSKASKFGTNSKDIATEMVQRLLEKPFEGVACDDYAYTVMGLLDYATYVDSTKSTINFAREIQKQQDALFKADLGYFYSPVSPHLFARAKFCNDTMEPNYNAVSVHNLKKLEYDTVAKTSEKLGVAGSFSHPLSHLSWCEHVI